MYLLDTNVVSELRKLGTRRAAPAVVSWAASVAASDLYLSVITLLELEMGILQVERRDTAQSAILRRWLTGQVMPTFHERLLPIDVPIALRCAALHVPERRSERDALIAATAVVHGLAVVTRNVADLEGTGVAVIDPWQHR
jgi:hypothetical protein